MIQTAVLSRPVPLHPRASSAKAAGESGDFAGAFAQAGDGAELETFSPAAEEGSRQDDAATGNALPLPQIALDPTFAWQPIVAIPSPVPVAPMVESANVTVGTTPSVQRPLAPLPLSPATISSAATVVGTTANLRALLATSSPPARPLPASSLTTASPAARSLSASLLPAPSLPTPSLQQAVAPPPVAPLPATLPAPVQPSGAPMEQLAATIMAAMPSVTAATQPPAPTQGDMPTTEISRWAMPATPVALAVFQPDAIQPQPGTVASAAMVFGAAIQAATKTREEPDTPTPADTPLTPVGATTAHEIKIADAQQAPLDMRQERWPHAMIERIEMLRDAADAVDTRIRLVPDALGAIDVSVKTEGDTVRVHFNAEQTATRTLLADAQPRLAELAEARGLKLSQGSLGEGSAHQQRAPATPRTPNRPAPVSTVIADAPDDIRIA